MEKLNINIVINIIISLLFFGSIHPSFADSAKDFNSQGIERAKKGDLNKAYELFKEAVKTDPKFSKAHFNLAQAAFDLGKKNEALIAYQSFILLNPESSEKKEILKTIIKLRKELKIGVPGSEKKTYSKSGRLALSEKYDNAESLLKKSIDKNPWLLEGYFNLATVYALQGNNKDSKTQMRVYSELNDDFSDTALKQKKIDEILIQSKKTQKALDDAKTKDEKAKSVTKHKGVVLLGAMGLIWPDRNAHKDTITIKNREVFSGSKGFDLHMFSHNPDTFLYLRMGMGLDSISVKSGAPDIPVLSSNKLFSGNVSPTDLSITSLYGGIGFKNKGLYFVIDGGFWLLVPSKLSTPVTIGTEEIESIPVHEIVLVGSVAVGSEFMINSKFSGIIEAKYTAPPFSSIIRSSSGASGVPSVRGAQWFGLMKLGLGIAWKF